MKTMKSFLSNHSGFSFMEVLIAQSIVAIALACGTAAVVAGQRANGHQEHLTNAINVGETVMEELFLKPKGVGDLSPGTHIREYSANGEAQSDDEGLYTARWEVKTNTPSTGIMRIKVEVSWKEEKANRSITFTSFRS